MTPAKDTASYLAALYTESFGGKGAGRYRIPAKHVRDLMGQKRVYPDDIHALTRAMFELGYLFIDMDSFYVVLSANSFVNYRRTSAEAITRIAAKING